MTDPNAKTYHEHVLMIKKNNGKDGLRINETRENFDCGFLADPSARKIGHEFMTEASAKNWR